MTRAIYQSMFVSLSMLLMAVFFVVQPSDKEEMKAFQTQLKEEFSIASAEILQGESFVEPFAFVWSSISNFYDVSANEALALLQPDSAFNDLAMMFNKEYQANLKIAAVPVLPHPPTEDALINIVPVDENEFLLDPYFNEDLAYGILGEGVVAGESIDIYEDDIIEKPISPVPPVVWRTINDSITGDPNCVAIFNGTVNAYPGPCAQEEDLGQVYEN
ncbi:MAG: hypothetical protein KW793_04325 [Candidatus Doudnabacteria bacterium]|nr:hypothetical protein [Candidatus Doudnabacteria bacterium]